MQFNKYTHTHTSFLQTGGGNCGRPAGSFAGHGVCTTCASHRGGNGFEGRERANGGGIGGGGGNGDGNGGGNEDVNGDGNRDGTGTRTGVEANEGTQDGNGGGNGDRSGDGNKSSSGYGIGEGRGEAKNCKKSHKSCRRDVGNRGDLRKNVDEEGFAQYLPTQIN